MLMNERRLRVLVIEDSPSDRLIVRRALERTSCVASVQMANDGAEAMACLRVQTTHAPRPDLILLDLNLPGKDGRKLLQELKSDPQLKMIPVVVVSSSRAERDIAEAYAHHANSYLTKPVDFSEFTRSLAALTAYWSDTVVLPNSVS